MNVNDNISTKVKLRNLTLPEDYVHIARLINSIEPGSTTLEALENEDQHIPTKSSLTLDENGLLTGFGRIRVVAEDSDGQVIGYGASWRAPWSDPGELASTFCVHPNYQRQAVGELILSHLENWAASHKASVLLSEVKDWIPGSLPFAKKHGFLLDAHIFELRLNLNQLDFTKIADPIHRLKDSGITFVTLSDIPGEVSEKKLYDLYVETSKDNPGQSGNLPAFSQWRKEALPEDCSQEKWVFIALDGDDFVGVSTLFSTEDTGVMYTDYTGVKSNYRGRGIAKALKLLSMQTALNEGAHTMTTDTEAGNEAMQTLNKGLGYLPGKGHIVSLKSWRINRMEKLQFLYKLNLIPSLLDEANWTEREEGIVQHHFEVLQGLLQEGKLILAGRTLNMDPTGMGIVILEVDSEEEAREIMENDPAVKEGVMEASLFPYRVALIRK